MRRSSVNAFLAASLLSSLCFGQAASQPSPLPELSWKASGEVVLAPKDPTRGILSIKGERRSETGEHNDRYSRIERRYGAFHRRFALPDSADPEGITAAGRNGVLEISIPKRPEKTPRRIMVGNAAQGSRMQGSGSQPELQDTSDGGRDTRQ